MNKVRCSWANSSDLMRDYHDTEWGVPVSTDNEMFEMLCLEMFQTGLSWAIVLNKRERFRACFYNFDVNRVMLMTTEDVDVLVNDASIIRHRQKIEAVIHNAKRIAVIQKSQRFTTYLEAQIFAHPKWHELVKNPFDPSTTVYTDLAKVLKKDGFKFIGPSVVVSLLEAVGYLDKHVDSCFCSGKNTPT